MKLKTSPYPGLDRERFRRVLARKASVADHAPVQAVSLALGITPLEASRMLRRGHQCSADNFLKACQWLEMSPLSFLHEEPAVPHG